MKRVLFLTFFMFVFTAVVSPAATALPDLRINEVAFQGGVIFPGNPLGKDWVELYMVDDGNGGSGADLTGYKFDDDGVFKTLGPCTLRTGEFLLLIFGDSTTPDETVATDGVLRVYTSRDGLVGTNEQIRLRRPDNSIADVVCWASSTFGGSEATEVGNLMAAPASWEDIDEIPGPSRTDCVPNFTTGGKSIARGRNSEDTNTRRDWQYETSPTPGAPNNPLQTLSYFRISGYPGYVLPDTDFNLKIEAIGNGGTVMTNYANKIELTASAGSVTPSSVPITAFTSYGEASITVRLSSTGRITITARDGATGSPTKFINVVNSFPNPTLLINEVAYKSGGGGITTDWVELYMKDDGMGGQGYDLGGWQFQDDGVKKTWAVNTYLRTGEYLLLIFEDAVSVDETTATNGVLKTYTAATGLTSTDEQAIIKDSSGQVRDCVCWTDGDLGSEASDVSLLINNGQWLDYDNTGGANPGTAGDCVPTLTINGASLARDDISTDTNSRDDWHQENSPTPGRVNNPVPVLSGFRISGFPSYVRPNTGFQITVEALNQFGTLFTSYRGNTTLLCSLGTISPQIINNAQFTAGVANVTVTLSQTGRVQIIATDGGKTGVSRFINVVSTIPAPTIVINEVAWNANTAGIAGDWIELYMKDDGTGGAGYDLGGYKFEDDNVFKTIEPNTYLRTGEYLLLELNSSGTDAQSAIGGVLKLFSTHSGLTSTNEQVILRDSSGAIVDCVCWANEDLRSSTTEKNQVQNLIDNGMWFDFEPAGAGPEDCVEGGWTARNSIARDSTGSDTNRKTDFIRETNPTPGAQNRLVASLAGFSLTPATSYIIANKPSPLTITATGNDGKTLTSYAGNITLSTSAGSISPVNVPASLFRSGVATVNITLDVLGEILLTATDGSATGTCSVTVTSSPPSPTLVINEVAFDGGDTTYPQDWIELYCLDDGRNGAGYDFGGWSLYDDSTFKTFESGTVLKTGEFLLVLMNSTSADEKKANTDGVLKVYCPKSGLTSTDEQVFLKDSSGSIRDAVCWSDTTLNADEIAAVQTAIDSGNWEDFSPPGADANDCIDSVPVKSKMSIGRDGSGTDTNSKKDWTYFATPTPGNRNYRRGVPLSLILEPTSEVFTVTGSRVSLTLRAVDVWNTTVTGATNKVRVTTSTGQALISLDGISWSNSASAPLAAGKLTVLFASNAIGRITLTATDESGILKPASKIIDVSAFPGVVISEIMYNPPSSLTDDSKGEFIELANISGASVELSGWTMKIGSTLYTFPDGTVMAADSRLVIASNLAGFDQIYGNNSGVWGDSPRESFTLLTRSFSLPNTSGTITLTSLDRKYTTTINYTSTMGGNGDGTSLEKIDLSIRDSGDPLVDMFNWKSGSINQTGPGTPGTRNDAETSAPSPMEILHTPVTEAEIHSDIILTALVKGATNVKLFYRAAAQKGLPSTPYITLNMSNVFGTNVYHGVIPSTSLRLSGMEYYIVATGPTSRTVSPPGAPETSIYQITIKDSYPKITFASSMSSVSAGTVFYYDATIANASGLRSMEFTLSFDPRLFEAIDSAVYREGVQLEKGKLFAEAFDEINTINNKTGQVSYRVTSSKTVSGKTGHAARILLKARVSENITHTPSVTNLTVNGSSALELYVGAIRLSTHSSTTIGSAGGTVEGPGGFKIEFPPAALRSDTEIRIERLSSGFPEFRGSETLIPSDIAYRITPEDLKLYRPVRITFPYTAAEIPEGATETKLTLWRFGEGRMLAPGTSTPDKISPASLPESPTPPVSRMEENRDQTGEGTGKKKNLLRKLFGDPVKKKTGTDRTGSISPSASDIDIPSPSPSNSPRGSHRFSPATSVSGWYPVSFERNTKGNCITAEITKFGYFRLVASLEKSENMEITDFEIKPDPFSPDSNGLNDQAIMSFNLSCNATVTLRIFDMRGSAVRVLLNEKKLMRGEKRIEWDGMDDSGMVVPTGKYLVQLVTVNEDSNKTARALKTITVSRKMRDR